MKYNANYVIIYSRFNLYVPTDFAADVKLGAFQV